jgi:signal transduction histidine kinase
VRAYSLNSRIFIFLILLILLSSSGIALMLRSQDGLSLASAQIREVLLPTSRILEQAQTELDLQIQELRLLTTLRRSTNAEAQEAGAVPPGRQDSRLLGLSPSVRALLNMQSTPLFPQVLAPLIEPWAQSARAYQERSESLPSLEAAVRDLQELREKTRILQRAVQREFSVQLLSLSNSAHSNLVLWAVALVLQTAAALVFVLLVWRWMSPLERIRVWLEDSFSSRRLLDTAPPRSVAGSGLLSPPAEVQGLVEAFRGLVGRFREQAHELDARSAKTLEDARAIALLFAGLHQMTRHNQELLGELIKREKLASMSEMAAQLAHEIRNPLNSLNLKLELLRDELPAEQQARVDAVLGEIDRLDALTESHLRTTRQRVAAAEAFEAEHPASVLESTAATLEIFRDEAAARGIALGEARGPEISSTLPANVLKAVLVNLLKNALEAHDGAPVGERRVLVETEIHSGGEWSLHVLDTGRGFPVEEGRFRVESFRTTKPEGSGLGLATSKSMLEAYGARLEIQPGPAGWSTRVSLRAPASTLAKAPDAGADSGLGSENT